jgi:hypothetical protein
MSKKNKKKNKKRRSKRNKRGEKYLRRYTNLEALRRLLREQKLTLRKPESWPDTNDSHYLELYRQKMKLSSVLALCFTQSSERFHYWEAFGKRTDPTERVQIKFKRSGLVEALKGQPYLNYREVEYLTMNDIKVRTLRKEELPFIKRYGFNHESEFRIIYESQEEKLSEKDIHIPLSCINKITLSPWLPRSSFIAIRDELHNITDCSGLRIVRSTLIRNKEWKKYGESAV